METQFLNTFVTVVDRGSMAAAARLLHITPAAVAQQIRTLERELGAPLIARAGRTVSVTEEGARILQRARDLLRDVADLRSVANESGMAGELRLGACPTALGGLVPDMLARMVAKFPEINVFIKPGYSADLYGAVESGDLDAAMVLQAPFPLPKTCDWQLLREEPLVVLAPARLAGCDPHQLLREEPLIRYDRHEWGGRQADEYLRKVGIVPRERFELNALNAIAVMVDRGLGVSLVPDWAKPWPEGISVVSLPLPQPSEPRRIGLVWSRASVRLRQVNALLEEARAALIR
ncbi:LysR family transcriptional regulator [Stenotrophomonas sp. ATCM1_4]|uniref:LysR family transcriptional regulator n=1 Tax=Stenotrophomonas capsici TaxID=3110230 RepID=A0ABU5V5V1_9GAMM|nr:MULTISPECIES: LysR family transcriptional regulator [unclassified Stenotrophomonas]MBD9536046.1 LysR family transcriptional regulator [Stenotrophomonas sp. STM01]MEA5668099.1 LysR family transcriptional regulator [Stenotrophomonas sp. MH1]TDB27551.1 LysR family transcriptional regulator [Stenotrophomonas sp. ATCM1_4]